jgi:hypothetical protein
MSDMLGAMAHAPHKDWSSIALSALGEAGMRRGGARAAVVEQLALALGPALPPAEEPPDPELTARMLSALADEGARLLLTEPDHFPVERILAQARWFLGLLSPGAR